MTFITTNKCNSRCSMCNIWKNKSAEKELSLNEIEKMLRNSTFLKNLRYVGLSGGEPFLRKDLVDLCLLIEKLTKIDTIRITTNGISYHKIKRDLDILLKKSNLNISIKVSLDGLGETHNKIRGINSFDRVKKTLDHLKLNLSLYPKKFDVTVGFTILQENFNELFKTFKFAYENGFNFFYKPAISGNIFSNLNEKFEYSQKMISSIKKQIEKIKKYELKSKVSRKKIINIINDIFEECVIDFMENPSKRVLPCYAGRASFVLNYNGEIYPCMILPKSFGNVRNQDFDEIWTSEKAEKIRKYIDKNRCSCITSCDIYPSILYSKTFKIVKNFLKVKVIS